MAKTKLMQADEIAHAFNAVADRGYWKAAVAGGRTTPEVNFNSRSSMVRVTYRINAADFTVTFIKTDAAFGDFMASTYRALAQIMAALKAAGLPFAHPVGPDACLRIEYDPLVKVATVAIANMGDDWPQAEPMPFKVPERKSDEASTFAVDGLNIDL